MIFSDKCWKRVTKYLLTTYHGKVNYQYKQNFQLKFTNNLKPFKVWFIIRCSKQLFPFFCKETYLSALKNEQDVLLKPLRQAKTSNGKRRWECCKVSLPFVRIRLLQQNWPISAPLSRGLRLGCKQTWRTKISSSNLKYLWSLCKTSCVSRIYPFGSCFLYKILRAIHECIRYIFISFKRL